MNTLDRIDLHTCDYLVRLGVMRLHEGGDQPPRYAWAPNVKSQ